MAVKETPEGRSRVGSGEGPHLGPLALREALPLPVVSGQVSKCVLAAASPSVDRGQQ